MEIRNVMTPEVEVIRPDATIQQAAQAMATVDVGAIPVCNGDRLVGMLTDRDIAVRAVARGRNPVTTRVEDVMTDHIVYCFDDAPVEEAARKMSEHQIRRLPVIDRGKHLVGIVALGDLAVERVDGALTNKVLIDVSTPASPAG